MRKRFPTRLLLWGAMACLLLSGCARDRVREAAEMEEAEKAWAAAVTRQDLPALASILSDELIYVHSTGLVENKAQYLEKMKSGAQRYDSIEHQEMTRQSFGGAGYVASRVRMQGATNGQPFDNTLRMMHFWVKEKGAWRLVAHQTLRLNP